MSNSKVDRKQDRDSLNRSNDSKENRGESSGKKKHEKEKRPKRFLQDLNVKPYLQAIGAITVLALAVVISMGMKGKVVNLDVSNAEQMKSTFFGGDSWAILCQPPNDNIIYSPFAEAAKSMTGEGVNFGVVDCEGNLPSGRTIVDRFKLNKKIIPTMFVSNSLLFKKPKQVLPRYLKSADKIASEIRLLLKSDFLVSSSKELRNSCVDGVNGTTCALFLKGSMHDENLDGLMVSTLKRFRNKTMKVAVMNSLTHQISIESNMFPFIPGQNRLIYFVQDGKQLRSKAYHGDSKPQHMFDFLESCMRNETRLKKLSVPPNLTKRLTNVDELSNLKKYKGGSNGDKKEKAHANVGPRKSKDKEEKKENQEELNPDPNAKVRAEWEAERRRQMHEEMDNFLFEDGDEDNENDEQPSHASEAYEIEDDNEDDEEEVIDLD